MNRPCPSQPITCPGFINSPVLNNSSEAPDTLVFDGFSFGGPYNPPLGKTFTAANCWLSCQSTVSQEDADLCAATFSFMCQNTDPSTGQPYGGGIFYFNPPVTITLHCSNGLPFAYTMPAGLFAGMSQAQANQQAQSYARNLAHKHLLCMSDLDDTPICLGVAYEATITASTQQDATNAVWTVVSGALPDGIEFSGSGKTGTFSGTPTAVGEFGFAIMVTLPNGDNMTTPYTINVAGITTASPLPSVVSGTPYSQQLATSGFSAPVFAIMSGALPAGLSISTNGLISGIPSSNIGSVFTVAVVESDLAQLPVSCSKIFTIGGLNVTPDIFSGTVSYFNGGAAIPAGNYRITYVRGALQYNVALGWALNLYRGGIWNGYLATYSGGTIQFTAGTQSQFASQAAVEAANAGASITIAHAGGLIGMSLLDNPYFDNLPGSPNPTFNLVSL